MYECEEYGLKITDKRNILTGKQQNNLANNIRKICYYFSCKTERLEEGRKMIFFLSYAKLFFTLYSDNKSTFVAFYDMKNDIILDSVDVSAFKPSKNWFYDLKKRGDYCLTRDFPNRLITSAQIENAWNVFLRNKYGENGIPTNGKVESSVPHITEPDFLELDDM